MRKQSEFSLPTHENRRLIMRADEKLSFVDLEPSIRAGTG
jgi:hypothetical protein